MIVLAFRTDKPLAEIYLYDGDNLLSKEEWEAHRRLSVDILQKIQNILDQNNVSKQNLGGVLIFKGPGSFTGLRIGCSVANTLSDGLNIPIVGSQGDGWLIDGLKLLQQDNQNHTIVLPDYGGEANITKPRK